MSSTTCGQMYQHRRASSHGARYIDMRIRFIESSEILFGVVKVIRTFHHVRAARHWFEKTNRVWLSRLSLLCTQDPWSVRSANPLSSRMSQKNACFALGKHPHKRPNRDSSGRYRNKTSKRYWLSACEKRGLDLEIHSMGPPSASVKARVRVLGLRVGQNGLFG